MQANISKLQKQIDKAVAERNAAEGRSQRNAASLLKVKADLAALEIKLQVLNVLGNAISDEAEGESACSCQRPGLQLSRSSCCCLHVLISVLKALHKIRAHSKCRTLL